uniref:Pseudouridine synthase n=1 Tax=Steinernema glaseri TaxID=37863 RepID=A0A1I7ZRG7_9BILA
MSFSARSLSAARCSHLLGGCRPSSSEASQAASSKFIHAAMTPKTFSNSRDLAEYLRRTHVFHKAGDFLILNKPYGVSTFGYLQPTGGIFENSRYDRKKETEAETGVDAEDKPKEPTIESALPYLRHQFGEPFLEISTGLKRYLSGPIIVPCSPQSANFLKESKKFASSLNDNQDHPFTHHRALVICVGRPKLTNEVLSGYATFQTVGDRSEYIFVEGKAKRRAKSGKYAVSGTVEYEVLHSQNGCSLIDLKFGKFSRHLPRLAMSHIMCPILGDSIYQNRLVTVNDELHSVEPKFIKRNKHRLFVPSELLQRLNITMPEYMSKIPMFFHVYQTVFPRYGNAKDKKIPDLIAMTPPPENFSAMLDVLGFTDAARKHFSGLTPEDDFEAVDSVTTKEKSF